VQADKIIRQTAAIAIIAKFGIQLGSQFLLDLCSFIPAPCKLSGGLVNASVRFNLGSLNLANKLSIAFAVRFNTIRALKQNAHKKSRNQKGCGQ
jgi:hypothetical protein